MITLLLLATLQTQAQQSAATNPLDDAEAKIEQQQFPAAKAELQTYITAHSDDARALYDLGFVEYSTGHAAEAEAALRHALKTQPGLAEAEITLGRVLVAEGKPQDASALWQHVAGDSAAAPKLRGEGARALVQIALAAKDYPAAQNALLIALAVTPETPDDTILAGKLAEAQGENDDAEAQYRKAIANGAPVEGGAALAHLLRAEKKYPEAETELRALLASDKDNAAIQAQLASTLALEGKNDEALALLKAAHDKDPANDATTRLLADVANVRGADPALAAQLYSELLAKAPNDPDLQAELGAALIRCQRYADAIPALKAALVAQPTNPEAWGSLAFAAEQTQQWPLVIQALTARKKYAAENASTYFLLGQAYDKLRHNKEAADYYRQFLATAGGKFPDQEFQVRHRLIAMAHENK